jgi:hypothetical protein
VNAWRPYRPPTWRQPVGWGALHETPPVITAPVVRESPGDWLFNGILRPAWAYRLELALIALIAVAYVWLGDRLGRAGAERLIVAAALVVAMVTWTREPLAQPCSGPTCAGGGRWPVAMPSWPPRMTASLGSSAVGSPGPASSSGSGSRPAAKCPIWRLRPNGSPPSWPSARSGWVRDPASARYARVVVLRRDPLADPQPIPWPLVTADRCSLWHPIPVGEDEDGNQVEVLLPERSLLLGAEPGGGKSTVA